MSPFGGADGGAEKCLCANNRGPAASPLQTSRSLDHIPHRPAQVVAGEKVREFRASRLHLVSVGGLPARLDGVAALSFFTPRRAAWGPPLFVGGGLELRAGQTAPLSLWLCGIAVGGCGFEPVVARHRVARVARRFAARHIQNLRNDAGGRLSGPQRVFFDARPQPYRQLRKMKQARLGHAGEPLPPEKDPAGRAAELFHRR